MKYNNNKLSIINKVKLYYAKGSTIVGVFSEKTYDIGESKDERSLNFGRNWIIRFVGRPHPIHVSVM